MILKESDDANVILTSEQSATFVESSYSSMRLPQSDVAPRRSDSLNHRPARPFLYSTKYSFVSTLLCL